VSSKSLLALLVLGAAGCASQPKPSGGGLPQSEPMEAPVSRNRDVITAQELSNPQYRSQNVLEVVRVLRPRFLVDRGKNSHTDPEAGIVHASLDNGRVMAVDELRNILVANVKEIRYLDPAKAMQKFGGSAREGPVILVLTQ
jgi:hypothetical protein